MRLRFLAVAHVLVMGFGSGLFADEVYLNNGDRLSGRIVSDTEEELIVEHEAAGILSVDRVFVKQVVRDEQMKQAEIVASSKKDKEKLWSGETSLGYSLSRGNTEDKDLSGSFSTNRKTDHDEFSMKANGLYEAVDRKMITQRYSVNVRYAFSFGRRLAWYNFYSLGVDHDRSANVDWRLVPSSGVGYWFADKDEWKLMTEVGLGLEKTKFRDTTPDRSDMVLVSKSFASKTLFGKSSISQDLTIWPNIGQFGEYRLRAETALTNPLAGGVSLRVSFIDEFQTDPALDTKENDARFISSLVYNF